MSEGQQTERAIITFPKGDLLHLFILETFAKTGRSPTLDQIQHQFQLATMSDAEARVTALERTGAIHRNPGDAVVTHAYPFSNDPTWHRVRLARGPQVYSMCAIDALGIPFMLGRDATISSRCAGCGNDVMVEVRGHKVVSHQPAQIVIWLAEVRKDCLAATDLCPDLNFFCSPHHLGRWRDVARASGAELSLGESVIRAREIFEHVMQD